MKPALLLASCCLLVACGPSRSERMQELFAPTRADFGLGTPDDVIVLNCHFESNYQGDTYHYDTKLYDYRDDHRTRAKSDDGRVVIGSGSSEVWAALHFFDERMQLFIPVHLEDDYDINEGLGGYLSKDERGCHTLIQSWDNTTKIGPARPWDREHVEFTYCRHEVAASGGFITRGGYFNTYQEGKASFAEATLDQSINIGPCSLVCSGPRFTPDTGGCH